MENKIPRRKSHVTLRIFTSGERILFDLKSRQTYKMNKTALEIWSLCNGSHSIDHIIKTIVDKFGVDETEARTDVEEFVSKLSSLGLIEI